MPAKRGDRPRGSELKSRPKPKRAAPEKRVYRLAARADTAAETARSILRATIDLYSERFYDQVSLVDIAKRAGVTVQTLIRRFGSKEELISAAADASQGTIRSQRDETTVGDMASAVKALIETYEAHGDRVLRMLAQEDRVPAFRLITNTGRAYHYEWVDRIFAPLLAKASRRDRGRLRAQIVAVCDVYFWKLLRHDLGMSSEETQRALLHMLAALDASRS
jgi:AcrR family transcriptional regulator